MNLAQILACWLSSRFSLRFMLVFPKLTIDLSNLILLI